MARHPRRAASGSISARLRSDGRWESRLTLPDGRRKSYYDTTESGAIRKRLDAESDIEQGIYAEPGKATLDDVWRDYHRLNPDNLRDRSLKTRAALYTSHIKPLIGHVRMHSINANHCHEVVAHARRMEDGNRKYADNTVRDIHTAQRAILRYAVNSGLIGTNPAERVKAPQGGDPRDLPITTPDQVERLMEAISRSPGVTALTLGIGLGMRIGEVKGLRWSNIDMDARVVRIRHQGEVVNGKVTFQPLKTKSARRDLPMPAFVYEALKNERKAQAEKRLRLGPEWHNYDLVATITGWIVSDSSASRWVKNVCKDADVPDIVFHQLRHLCATLLMARNVPPRVVQQILGHVSEGTAMRIYQHVWNNQLVEAMAELDSSFQIVEDQVVGDDRPPRGITRLPRK